METLTEMLRENLGMEPECDAEAEATEHELTTVKNTFKEWLNTVHLGGMTQQTLEVIESTRKLLIILVDEP